jgi:hypothetical protein
MTDIEADLLIANARIKILEKELEERSDGCEFCLNGEHLTCRDKYGDFVDMKFCPMCGRRLEG